MAKLKEQQKSVDAKPVNTSNSEEKNISLNQNNIENILKPVPLKPHIDSVSNPQQVILVCYSLLLIIQILYNLYRPYIC